MSVALYRHWPKAKLEQKIKLFDEGIDAVQGGAQSYSMNGVSITRANLDSQIAVLGEMYAALAKKNGTNPSSAQGIARRQTDCY